MSGAQAPGTAAAAGEGTTRRRKPTRPPTVPLADFGKAPPPPPRIRLTPRQIVTYTASGIVVVAWAAAHEAAQRSHQK